MKSNNNTVIGVCGFGYSGSGAILDLLKESNDIEVKDSIEFSFVYKPDGLEDLADSVSYRPSRYFSSDSAIRRFIQYMSRYNKIYNHFTKGNFDNILNLYLKSIIGTTWIGCTSVHIYQASSLNYIFKQYLGRRFRSKYEKIFGPLRGHAFPEQKMYYSYLQPEVFDSITRTFVEQICEAARDHKEKLLVLDQCFAANNPVKSFNYFKNPKAIIVNRDPRDVYLLSKRSLGYTGRFTPIDSVEKFVIYYKGLMESGKDLDDNRILNIQFEDLIYKYDDTKKIIKDFLGVEFSSDLQFSKFNPNVSINNTQLWLKYRDYENDIKYIEEKLTKYLYDYNYIKVKPNFANNPF